MNQPLKEEEKHPGTAIALTCISSGAAVIGGVLVVLIGSPSRVLMGHMLSFAAGIMLYISYADLLPHAVSGLSVPSPSHDHDHGHSHDLHAFGQAHMWLFAGMVLLLLIMALIPEPTEDHDDAAEQPASGATSASAASGAGDSSTTLSKSDTKHLWMTGLIAAIGITLHNFPEGLIVYNQTITGICSGADGGPPPALPADADMLSKALGAPWQSCMSRGVAITFAIFLHNIPEGMAVTSPVYVATGSAYQALKYCVLSSAAEPLAAIFFGYAFSQYMTPYTIAALNAMVAGIMICLCLVELMPTACRYVGPKVCSRLHDADERTARTVLFGGGHARVLVRMRGMRISLSRPPHALPGVAARPRTRCRLRWSATSLARL